ncbi:MAG: response regulator [Vicinamibacteria bacterium]
MNIKCPKCSTTIDAEPDELGTVTCGSCGAKLRSKAAVKVTVQGGASSSNPSLPRIAASVAAPADVDSVLARIDSPPSPDATIRPGVLPKLPRPGEAVPGPVAAALQELLGEIRALRQGQQQILALLRGGGEAAPGLDEPESDSDELRPAPRASGARRVVLVVDDDAQARQEAVAALQTLAAVKTAADGEAALRAIASEKPAAIVLELGLAGSLPGRDLVNMIKATMEWVDVPLVIYTRMEIADEEAHLHGADVIVRKGPGRAAALATRVAALISRQAK